MSGAWLHGPAKGPGKGPAGGPGHGPPSGIPARGSSRPALPEGHALGLRSGYRSPRVYGALAEALAAGLLADRPDLGAYPEAVAGWATAEACAALLRRHLDEVGAIDPATHEPRATSLNALRQYERQAVEHRATLGLDPRSEASLMRERATAAALVVDLDALAERGRRALAGQAADERDLAGEALARVRGESAAVLAQATQATHDERRAGP